MALAEDAVTAVKNTLESDLETVLTARGLTDIAQYILGEKTLDELLATPVVYIFADESLIEGWRKNPEGQWDATHTLTIGVVIEALNTDTLRQNLYKYTRAIMEVIVDAYPTDSFWPRGSFRVRFSPVLTRQSRYLGDAAITIRFQRVEDR